MPKQKNLPLEEIYPILSEKPTPDLVAILKFLQNILNERKEAAEAEINAINGKQ